MSRVKGAPWDFKVETTSTMVVSHRVDGRPPDPPIEVPPRFNVRIMYTRRLDVQKFGPAKGCPGCQKVTRRTDIVHRGRTQ